MSPPQALTAEIGPLREMAKNVERDSAVRTDMEVCLLSFFVFFRPL